MKITKQQATAIAAAVIALLTALGLITACTNSLFVLKGYGNKAKTENRTQIDSTKINVQP